MLMFISEQFFSSSLKVLHTRAHFCKLSIAPCFFLLLLSLVVNSHGLGNIVFPILWSVSYERCDEPVFEYVLEQEGFHNWFCKSHLWDGLLDFVLQNPVCTDTYYIIAEFFFSCGLLVLGREWLPLALCTSLHPGQ